MLKRDLQIKFIIIQIQLQIYKCVHGLGPERLF